MDYTPFYLGLMFGTIWGLMAINAATQQHQHKNLPVERLKTALLAHALDTVNKQPLPTIYEEHPILHYFSPDTQNQMTSYITDMDLNAARDIFERYICTKK